MNTPSRGHDSLGFKYHKVNLYLDTCYLCKQYVYSLFVDKIDLTNNYLFANRLDIEKTL